MFVAATPVGVLGLAPCVGRCGSHTGVESAATAAVPLLVYHGAPMPFWRLSIRYEICPTKARVRAVLWIFVAGINGEGSGGGGGLCMQL